MECYGQSETADTIKNSDDNPQNLLDFLDGFLEIGNLKLEDELFKTSIINVEHHNSHLASSFFASNFENVVRC